MICTQSLLLGNRLGGELCALTLLSVILWAPHSAWAKPVFEAKWENITKGFAVGDLSVKFTDGRTITFTAVRANPAINKIKVIDVSGFLKTMRRFSIFVKNIDVTKHPIYKKRFKFTLDELFLMQAPRAVINGGYKASYSFLIPSGLLLIDDEEVTPLNEDSPSQSGVFCVHSKGVSIIFRDDFLQGVCHDALQAGPLLVEPGGKMGIKEAERERKPFRRSFVCVEKDGSVVIAATQEAHLYDIAYALVNGGEELGLACDSALNLSGHTESGLIIRGDVTSTKGEDRFIGATFEPIASAIAITDSLSITTLPVLDEAR